MWEYFCQKIIALIWQYLSIKKRSSITTRFYFQDNGIHHEGDGVTSWRTWQNSTWVAKFLELHEYILPDLLNFTVICYQYQHIPILCKLSQLAKIKIHKIQIKYPFFCPEVNYCSDWKSDTSLQQRIGKNLVTANLMRQVKLKH